MKLNVTNEIQDRRETTLESVHNVGWSSINKIGSGLAFLFRTILACRHSDGCIRISVCIREGVRTCTQYKLVSMFLVHPC